MGQRRNLINGALLVLLLSCSLGCGTINSIVLLNLGNWAYDAGQYPEALDRYQRGLEQAQNSSVKKQKTIGHLLSNLGLVYGRLGQYDRALEYYQQALDMRREIKDRTGEVESLNNLGWVYVDLGKYDRALEYFQQALAFSREIKDRGGEAASLHNLGVAYGNLGQYDRALDYYQQALAIRREIKKISRNSFLSLNPMTLLLAVYKKNKDINIRHRLGKGQ